MCGALHCVDFMKLRCIRMSRKWLLKGLSALCLAWTLISIGFGPALSFAQETQPQSIPQTQIEPPTDGLWVCVEETEYGLGASLKEAGWVCLNILPALVNLSHTIVGSDVRMASAQEHWNAMQNGTFWGILGEQNGWKQEDSFGKNLKNVLVAKLQGVVSGSRCVVETNVDRVRHPIRTANTGLYFTSDVCNQILQDIVVTPSREGLYLLGYDVERPTAQEWGRTYVAVPAILFPLARSESVSTALIRMEGQTSQAVAQTTSQLLVRTARRVGNDSPLITRGPSRTVWGPEARPLEIISPVRSQGTRSPTGATASLEEGGVAVATQVIETSPEAQAAVAALLDDFYATSTTPIIEAAPMTSPSPTLGSEILAPQVVLSQTVQTEKQTITAGKATSLEEATEEVQRRLYQAYLATAGFGEKYGTFEDWKAANFPDPSEDPAFTQVVAFDHQPAYRAISFVLLQGSEIVTEMERLAADLSDRLDGPTIRDLIEKLKQDFIKAVGRLEKSPLFSRTLRGNTYGKHMNGFLPKLFPLQESLKAIESRNGYVETISGLKTLALALQVLMLTGPRTKHFGQYRDLRLDVNEVLEQSIRFAKTQLPPMSFQKFPNPLQASTSELVRIPQQMNRHAFRFLLGLVFSDNLLRSLNHPAEISVRENDVGKVIVELQSDFPQYGYDGNPSITRPKFPIMHLASKLAQRWGFSLFGKNQPLLSGMGTEIRLSWSVPKEDRSVDLNTLPASNFGEPGVLDGAKPTIIEAGGKIFVWDGATHGHAFLAFEKMIRAEGFEGEAEILTAGEIKINNTQGLIEVELRDEVADGVKREIKKAIEPVSEGLRIQVKVKSF